MSSAGDMHHREFEERLCLHALRTLPPVEIAEVDAHVATCGGCEQELQRLRDVVGTFAYWPTDVLRPATSGWSRLAERIARETGQPPVAAPTTRPPGDSPWDQPAPGIECKLLATDTTDDRVSMLVRLAPGAAYPPHCHAGVEELHLLHGELYIDDRKLQPGDYNRAEPGTIDQRVWTETGCTCVLVTSARDQLG